MWMVRARLASAADRPGVDVGFVVAHAPLVGVFLLPAGQLLAVVEREDRQEILKLLQAALPQAGSIEIDEVTLIEAYYLRSPA